MKNSLPNVQAHSRAEETPEPNLEAGGALSDVVCCAFDFLKRFNHLPMQLNGNQPVKASNGEIRRWLESGSVIINGEKLKPKDPVEFPVWQLIFFPKGKRRITMQDEINSVAPLMSNAIDDDDGFIDRYKKTFIR